MFRHWQFPSLQYTNGEEKGERERERERERTETLTIKITLLITQLHQVQKFLAISNTFKTDGINYHHPILAVTSPLLQHSLLSRPTKFLTNKISELVGYCVHFNTIYSFALANYHIATKSLLTSEIDSSSMTTHVRVFTTKNPKP